MWMLAESELQTSISIGSIIAIITAILSVGGVVVVGLVKIRAESSRIWRAIEKNNTQSSRLLAEVVKDNKRTQEFLVLLASRAGQKDLVDIMRTMFRTSAVNLPEGANESNTLEWGEEGNKP